MCNGKEKGLYYLLSRSDTYLVVLPDAVPFLSEILEDDDQVNIKLVKLKQKIIKIGIETPHLTSVGEYLQNLKGVPRNNMG